jgi:hypothetical protein
MAPYPENRVAATLDGRSALAGKQRDLIAASSWTSQEEAQAASTIKPAATRHPPIADVPIVLHQFPLACRIAR